MDERLPPCRCSSPLDGAIISILLRCERGCRGWSGRLTSTQGCAGEEGWRVERSQPTETLVLSRRHSAREVQGQRTWSDDRTRRFSRFCSFDSVNTWRIRVTVCGFLNKMLFFCSIFEYLVTWTSEGEAERQVDLILQHLRSDPVIKEPDQRIQMTQKICGTYLGTIVEAHRLN